MHLPCIYSPPTNRSKTDSSTRRCQARLFSMTLSSSWQVSIYFNATLSLRLSSNSERVALHRRRRIWMCVILLRVCLYAPSQTYHSPSSPGRINLRGNICAASTVATNQTTIIVSKKSSEGTRLLSLLNGVTPSQKILFSSCCLGIFLLCYNYYQLNAILGRGFLQGSYVNSFRFHSHQYL